MATYFIDFLNGNNANAGTSFAARVKTFAGLASKGTVAGDTVRIMKSPDASSIGAAQWTNGSNTVTLAGACNATINTMESAWTAGAGVTVTADATIPKQGTNSGKFVIGGGYVAVTPMGYQTMASTDFSGYQQVCFWIRCTATTAASDFSVVLCSDTIGTNAVNTINVPAIPVINKWMAVVVDTAGALGATIQSVALVRNAGAGTPTIFLDNIFASKASASADSLTLFSVIGKNDSTGWFPVQSVSGTTIKLDNNFEYQNGQYNDWYGVTESVTTYKRECINRLANLGDTNALSGSVTADITFSGGWDTSAMSSQTGETFMVSPMGSNTMLLNTGNRCTFDKLSFVGGSVGISFSSAKLCTFSNGNVIGSAAVAIYFPTFQSGGNTVMNSNFSGGDAGTQNFGSGNRFYNCRFVGQTSYNVGAYGPNSFYDNCVMAANAANAIRCAGLQYGAQGFNNVFRGCTIARSASTDIIAESGPNYFDNCDFLSTTEFVDAFSLGGLDVIYSTNHDKTPDNHTQIMSGGRIFSEASVRHTATGISWKMSPTSTNRNSVYPMRLKVGRVYCTSGTTITVSCWLRRTNTALTGKLHVKGNQIGGPTVDTETSMAAAADTWEQISVTWTPASSGVVEVEALAYGGTTHSLYADDFAVV